MDLRRLRYFTVVAEELSFTAAARRLHLSQQSLSAAVRRLEGELGCHLLERTTQRVELTVAGHALLHRAPAVFAAVEEAVAAVRDGAGVVEGPLRLRYGLDSEQLVEPLLLDFGARHPGVAVQAWTGSDARNLDELRAGTVDGVFAWALADGGVTAGVEDTLLALPADHPLAAGPAVPVAALAGEVLVMFPRASAPAVWDVLARALGGRPVQTPVSGQGAMVAAVARGEGVAPVSARLAERLARPGVAIRPLEPPLQVPLRFVWRRPAPAPVRALVEDLARGTAT